VTGDRNAPVCPANPAHGRMHSLTTPEGSPRWRCGHVDHDGVKGDDGRFGPPTKSVFRPSEVGQ
jgi:hypothetical protein